MDKNIDIIYSFEEQCFKNIDALREELLKEEPELLSKRRKCMRQRLFRYNIFEEIKPKRKQELDKILCHALRSMGHQINGNLSKKDKKRTDSMRTPTPCRDLSASPVSSRAQSVVSATPSRVLRSRSVSNASDVLNPIDEVINISSDEEVSDDDDIKIKKEPEQEIPLNSDENSPNEPAASSSSEEVLGDSLRPEDRNFHKPDNQENSLLFPNRRLKSNYMYDRDGVIHLKGKQNIKYSVMSPARQPLFLHMVSKIIKLIETDRYMTKRELWYLCKEFCKVRRANHQPGNSQTQSSVFGTQANNTQYSGTQANGTQCNGTQSSEFQPTDSQHASQSQRNSQSLSDRYNQNKLDLTLDDLCCVFGCSRLHLRILTQAKGLVYGDLEFQLKNGEIFDCLSKNEAICLPTARYPIVKIRTSAKFIIVLEKDSVLQKILKQEESSHFVRDYKVILFTARGYPDVTSKAFLNYLWDKLKIPILALTDADPHGLEIVCAYKFGCYATAYEALYLAVPQIKWLGLLPGDIKRLELSETKTVPLSNVDLRKLNSLLDRPYLKDNDAWLVQLELMRITGRKAQLESLDANGEYLVNTYLPNKLKYNSWL